MRRVVCGNRNGQSVVISDGRAPAEHRFEHLPDHGAAIMWSTQPVPGVDPMEEAAPVGTTATPKAGETRLLMVRFPPSSVMFGPGFDPVAADLEQRQHLPGLAERFEADCPGMHRTHSVDYDVVVAGTICLELDDGVEIELNAGDVVVQQSTRHAWRNKSDDAATLCFVLVGTADA